MTKKPKLRGRAALSRWVALALLAAMLPLGAAAGVPAAAGQSVPSAGHDCNIQWNEVLHDTFNSDYRSIVGPTTPGTTVKLRLRTAQGDITSARVRVWNDRINAETYYNMVWDSAFDTDPTTYDYWFADILMGDQATILYYFFELNDGGGSCSPADQDFYTDDDPKFYGGGFGAMRDDYNDNYSFQLTVYDPTFSVPDWMQHGVVYQIFPDRFRDGAGGNNPPAGRFSYDQPGGAIVRSNQINWNYTVCDPRSTYSPSCPNKYGDNFYGGDLRGVIQKIEDGYFDNLGVSVLYLNPIFLSPSNHKYDTADFMRIDPDFGSLADFQELTSKAEARDIKVILDGVFNHTSSDSTYFDYYKRYDSNGNLTSPNGPGTDDNSGACESPFAAYRSWFYIGGSPPNSPIEKCDPGDIDDPGGAWTEAYEAWYGYGSLPKLQANLPAVRNLIWSNGLNSVGPYWTQQGADGWRFDVGGDVDPGLTNDVSNDYWEGFRSAVRSVNPQAVTLGEEWGDATAWLLGNEWDSVMNYRFRSALLSWLFTGCSGNGCTGNTSFADNDSNLNSSSGAISYISPSQFNARLRSIAEDYPPMAFKAMMNLEGSHDTNRVRFLLKKVNNNNDEAAVQRMKEWWLFAFTYPGAPTLYYGDEIGLNHDGVWTDKYEDDPYNRVPFPWPDATGSSYSYDTIAFSTGLQAFARQMASIRWSYRALQDGDVQHGLVIDDTNKLYGYARTNDSQTALIALNRSSSAHNVTFTGLNAAPYNLTDGTQLVNALTGDLSTVYTVNGGTVTINVTATWGAVLLEKNKIDTPAAVTSLAGSLAGSTVTLTWDTVKSDTGSARELVIGYEIHSGSEAGFTPIDSTRVATVTPSDADFRFGSSSAQFTWSGAALRQPNTTTFYKVCTLNAPGVANRIACPSVDPTAVTLAEFSAVQAGDYVLVTWETASELDNRGFNLYRGVSPAGPDRQLNTTLIPSQSQGSPSGFVYTWEDRADLVVGATYYYWLEDLDISGATTLHGPVSVDFSVPTAVTLGAVSASPATAGALSWLWIPAVAGAALAVSRLRRRS